MLEKNHKKAQFQSVHMDQWCGLAVEFVKVKGTEYFVQNLFSYYSRSSPILWFLFRVVFDAGGLSLGQSYERVVSLQYGL